MNFLPLIASHCILRCIRWHSRCGALCNRQSHAHVYTHVGTHHMQSQRASLSVPVCVCLLCACWFACECVCECVYLHFNFTLVCYLYALHSAMFLFPLSALHFAAGALSLLLSCSLLHSLYPLHAFELHFDDGGCDFNSPQLGTLLLLLWSSLLLLLLLLLCLLLLWLSQAS